MRPCVSIALAVVYAARLHAADEPAALLTSPLGEAFGASAVMWGLELSPDGSKISMIQPLPNGTTMARVFSFVDNKAQVVLAGKENDFDVQWCDWASDRRLLCGLRSVVALSPDLRVAVTRLIGVNADGSQPKLLLEDRTQWFAKFQDRVVDWLPDEPDYVLVQNPTEFGSSIVRLNVNDGTTVTVERDRDNAQAWIADGSGTPRVYASVNEQRRRWYVRDPARSDWTVLHETVLPDLDDAFEPVGFGANRNELLYYDTVDGRTALLAMDLENGRRTRVVYSHPTLDVGGGRTLGKDNRLVSVTYVDDRPHMHFIDQRIDKVNAALAPSFPGSAISVFDEDWSQRYYLVFVSGATNPGSYYRFDSQTRVLARIARTYPALADRELAPMREIRYPAPDGVQIPAYLTLPRGAKEKVAAVIVPHGGPSSRDYWEYDFLPQYLAANGYAVLQTNYRGSDGYGVAWRGAGGFRDWRRAVDDIAAGVDYLVQQGIADGKRICTIGWSYGGYAALMSAIEKPKLFRCVASIAGVTDPRALSDHQGNFVDGRSVRQLIGSSTEEVRIAGSPIERVGELAVPVLLAHAEQDLDVPFSQSVTFTKALRRARKNVEFAQYPSAEHDIRPERYRVDLLTRLGGFLEKNLD